MATDAPNAVPLPELRVRALRALRLVYEHAHPRIAEFVRETVTEYTTALEAECERLRSNPATEAQPPMTHRLFDPAVPFTSTFDGEEYRRARVVRCVDADTIVALLDLGHHVYHEARLRVASFNAAERFRGSATERAAGQAAWHDAQQLLREGDTIYVRTLKTAGGVERETFGRLVAVIRYRHSAAPGGQWIDFVATMRARGHDRAPTP